MHRWILLIAMLCAAPARAWELPLSIYCARGAADYPDAELRREGPGYVLDVVFVGYHPSRARAEWSLRECLNTALKHDASRDVVARLWYRERRSRRLEPIHAGLVYRAGTRSVVAARAAPAS